VSLSPSHSELSQISSSLGPTPAPRREPQDSSRQEFLAALLRQDDHAVALLSARWAHRHGVESMERLIQQVEGGSVPETEPIAPPSAGNPPGFEAPSLSPSRLFSPSPLDRAWQIGHPCEGAEEAPDPFAPELPSAEPFAGAAIDHDAPSVIESQAKQPAPRFNPIRRLKSLVRDCIDEVASTFQDGADPFEGEPEEPEPLPLSLTERARPMSRPPTAPVPLDLADLRSWLPDRHDDQPRRAS
jgi:hypothetical protein